jgi:hypothetical protein
MQRQRSQRLRTPRRGASPEQPATAGRYPSNLRWPETLQAFHARHALRHSRALAGLRLWNGSSAFLNEPAIRCADARPMPPQMSETIPSHHPVPNKLRGGGRFCPAAHSPRHRPT